MRPFGFHQSIAGGYTNALLSAQKLGLTAVQFFSRNPRGWVARSVPEEEVVQFRELQPTSGILVTVIHTNYLVNIANPDREVWKKSCRVLTEELTMGQKLAVDFVVTHLGSHRGQGREQGLARVLKAVQGAVEKTGLQAGKKPTLLLENSAGAGNLVGNRFDELATIMKEAGVGKCLGVCIDSAHAYAEGYDIGNAEGRRMVFDQLGEYASSIELIHLNDSRAELGSHRDRHEHLGKGTIGEAGLSGFLHDPLLSTQAVIMETPVDDAGRDEDNLAVFLRLDRSKH
jgi:deoxyribonuclease-4